MRNREAEFLQRLRAAFLVEAREHLQTVALALVALEKATTPDGRSQQLEIVFRHTHSLKGAARAANFPPIEAVCQDLEEVFALCKRRGRILTPADFDTLHRAFDLVGTHVDAGSTPPVNSASGDAHAVTRSLRAIAAGERDAGDVAGPVPPRTPDTLRQAPDGMACEVESTPPVAAAETIRVPTLQLERMLLAAEELLAVKQAGVDRADELRRIENAFGEWRDHWLSAQAPLRRLRSLAPSLPAETGKGAIDAMNHALEFVEWTFGHLQALEGRVRAAARAAARDQHAAGKQIDELLDGSKGLLMMPFDTIAGLMPRLVRDLARDQDKDVVLEVVGGDVKLDKRSLEQLKDPLVHLVRNAIDHGIETPSARLEAGKPERAHLSIEARLLQDQQVEILVADDGVGMDAERLRDASVRSGALDGDAARRLSEAQALELAFRSHVSTSPIITEISGRGLGLAIVREQVERLGGRVLLENRAPVGVRWRIVLPQDVATFRGLFVQVSGQTFVIPVTLVERVARLPRSEVKTVSGRDTVSIGGLAMALARLDRILELPPSSGHCAEFVMVVLVGGAAERIALVVDEVLHDEELLVKRLGRPLVRVRNVAGATVLGSGKVLPVLNVADLVKSARRAHAGAPAVARPLERNSVIGRRVLVAEDSITSRLLLKGILEAEGCEVKTVVDGIEAFTALRSEPFDLLVSDIEMPRLNGFDLTARVRADSRLTNLPVILVTALARREDRERGIDVGANAYITKGSFDQRDLVDAVRRLAVGREDA